MNLKNDVNHLIQETSNDKLEILRDLDENVDFGKQIKQKIDALAWHGRMLNLLSVNQINESIILFKRALLPTDNIQIRNLYIKTTNHRSQAVVQLS